MSIEDRNLKPGTVLVKRYKRRDYRCDVVKGKDGKVAYKVGNKTYSSPSAAGSGVMGGTACNGWQWWTVGRPDKPKKTKAATEGHRTRHGGQEARQEGEAHQQGEAGQRRRERRRACTRREADQLRRLRARVPDVTRSGRPHARRAPLPRGSRRRQPVVQTPHPAELQAARPAASLLETRQRRPQLVNAD